MERVLAQLQRSGSPFFVKRLAKTALIQTYGSKETATMSIPAQFVRDHNDKFEQWVILRTHQGRRDFGRPWLVRLSMPRRTPGESHIRGGLSAFIDGNRLIEGDFLIFVLKEGARSEFEVHIFRGPWGTPLHPDEGDDYASSDGETNRVSSPLYHPLERQKKTFTSNVPEGGTALRQPAKHDVIASFRKQLKPSSIGRYDRAPWTNSGQFGFPEDFIRTYGRLIQSSVKLQGIYEGSATHIIPCCRRSRNKLKVNFRVVGWSMFVRENGLKARDWLEFSLMADSYFVVRKL